MSLKNDAEQSTDSIHLKRMLKLLLTDNPEMKSSAVIVITVVVPAKLVSAELMTIELVRLNQGGCGETNQVILVAMPAGLVTIVGSARVNGAPI